MPTCKNYHVQGGDKWVVEGTLEIKEGATVTGLTATAAAASAEALGGVKAATKGDGDTVECKIDSATSKLYVPTYPVVPDIPAASAEALGGVKAATKGDGDTVECKIDDTSNKLYVPTYPVVPEIPVVENQLASEAATFEDLVTDFNTLLSALKTAGLMAADPEPVDPE